VEGALVMWLLEVSEGWDWDRHVEKEMTTGDIQDLLMEIYGLDVSAAFTSIVTERVTEIAAEWQSRPLEEIYPIVFFDAIHFKARQDHKIKTKAAHRPVMEWPLSGCYQILEKEMG